MQRMMEAEIITLNPDPIIGRLIELGFVIEEVIDWLGSDGSTIMASMLTELEEEEDFFHHVRAIVDPLGGAVNEAGLILKPGLVRRPGLVKRYPGQY